MLQGEADILAAITKDIKMEQKNRQRAYFLCEQRPLPLVQRLNCVYVNFLPPACFPPPRSVIFFNGVLTNFNLPVAF